MRTSFTPPLASPQRVGQNPWNRVANSQRNRVAKTRRNRVAKPAGNPHHYSIARLVTGFATIGG